MLKDKKDTALVMHPVTFSVRGRLMRLTTPQVMGILNVTPDSFFDGGRYDKLSQALKHVEAMLVQGADWIDIGGCSTRPGAEVVPEAEEIRRVLPVVEAIRKEWGTQVCLSVDTFRPAVAEAVLQAGVDMINDISGGGPAMWQVVARYRVPYVLMHMRGTPQTMQQLTHYPEGVTEAVLSYFAERLTQCRAHGISDVVLDPGFGFAKSLEQNYLLMRNLNMFGRLGCPLLVGISRKSMIYKLLDGGPEEALYATVALHAWAIFRGAHILRVHDVKAAKDCIVVMKQLLNS